MEIEYIKVNPSGNTTVFITSPLPRRVYAAVSEIVMKKEYLAAEQVGFIEKTEKGWHMEMMGGEFCGNASRSFAAWLVMKDLAPPLSADSHSYSFPIDVSGGGRLTAFVEKTDDPRTYDSTLEMPLPVRITEGRDSVIGDYCIVVFDGIAHVILRDREPADIIEETKKLLLEQGVPADAFGIMFHDTRRDFLTPLVFVSEVGSSVWENSCGSGSTAVAAAIAAKTQKNVSICLKQPGGSLKADVFLSEGRLSKILLSGSLAFTSEGTVFIPDGAVCRA